MEKLEKYHSMCFHWLYFHGEISIDYESRPLFTQVWASVGTRSFFELMY